MTPERDGPRDAVATYIEQTKLLVALASAFIVAPATILPLVVGKDAISAVASHITDLTRAELAQVGSVFAGYIVLATIAGYQNVGKYDVDRLATRIFSRLQIGLYVLGLYFFGQLLINILEAAAAATMRMH